VNRFDVSVYAIRRRAGRRRPFEVRWRAAGRSRSKSFITRGLADSYRAELVRAARMGLEFDPLTGEPAAWNLPEPATVTWYQQAVAYAAMKWPPLAAHSRASVADALATVTPALTRPGARDRPDPRELRTALYQHAFNPARPPGPGSPAAQILDWAQQASLPVGRLAGNAVVGGPQPCCRGQPRPGQGTARCGRPDPAGVDRLLRVPVLRRASPGGSRCPAPRRLRSARLQMGHAPAGRGHAQDRCRLDQQRHQPRAARTQAPAGRDDPDGPGPSVLVAMLCAHVTAYGTAPDGRLFRGTRGGPLSESVYGRAWHFARALALGPELAASGLARRPYDLRHAALSLWLNAGGDPAQIAARAGHSVAVLLTVYSHCIHGHEDLLNQQIGRVLEPSAGRGPCPSAESQRLHRPRDGRGRRPLCVRGFPARPADGPWTTPTPNGHTPKTPTLATVVYPDQSKY